MQLYIFVYNELLQLKHSYYSVNISLHKLKIYRRGNNIYSSNEEVYSQVYNKFLNRNFIEYVLLSVLP